MKKIWQIAIAICFLLLLMAPISAIQTNETSVTNEKEYQNDFNGENLEDQPVAGGFINENCLIIVFGRPMPFQAPELDDTSVPLVYSQIKFWMETGFCFTVGSWGIQRCSAPYCGTTDHHGYIGLVIPFGGILSYLFIGFTSYVYVLYG